VSPLRILALHGYHGSAALLSRQMRAWAEDLESRADFVCVDAPSLAAGDFGWWHAVGGRYQGWARTRDFIVSLCAEKGPFDGVFGFSQGAALAALLAGTRELALGFAIMAGGFVSSDETHAPLYTALASDALPSLHLIGRADAIVSARASHALASRFSDPLILEHDGGHVIPAGAAIRDATRRFLDQLAR
jgi:predicted esterase